MTFDPDRRRRAPALREVAQVWWDVDADPVVTWDADGRNFHLVDPHDPDDPHHRLDLLRLAAPAEDPSRVAAVLAEGLAACDFPPTGTGAALGRVRATLRAAKLDVGPIEPFA